MRSAFVFFVASPSIWTLRLFLFLALVLVPDARALADDYQFTLTEGTLRDAESGDAEALSGHFFVYCGFVLGPDCDQPTVDGIGYLGFREYQLQAGEEIYRSEEVYDSPRVSPVDFLGPSVGPWTVLPSAVETLGITVGDGEVSLFNLILSREVIEADEDSQTIRFEALLGEGTAQPSGGGGDGRFVLPTEISVEGARVAFERTFGFSDEACRPPGGDSTDPELPSLEEMGLFAPAGATVTLDEAGVLSVYTEGDLEISEGEFSIPGLTGLAFIAGGKITVDGAILVADTLSFTAEEIEFGPDTQLIASGTIEINVPGPLDLDTTPSMGDVTLTTGGIEIDLPLINDPWGIETRPDTGGSEVTLIVDPPLINDPGLILTRPATGDSGVTLVERKAKVDPRPGWCADGACVPEPPDREFLVGCSYLISQSEPEEIGSFSLVASRTREVEVEVWSGKKKKWIRLGRHRSVKVAVLGSEDLDVSEIDARSLRLGPDGAPAKMRGRKHARRRHYRDVNRDGYPDLKIRFKLRKSGIQKGDSEVCLTGSMQDGSLITGCDTHVRIRKR